MLLAGSHVLQVHLLIFTGGSEPQMISGINADAPLLPIACAHNQHFWALSVDRDDAPDRETLPSAAPQDIVLFQLATDMQTPGAWGDGEGTLCVPTG